LNFLIDMPLATRVAVELRADGHDAVHLSEQGLSRLADEEIFAKAMSEGRIIVTADLDFGEILARTGSTSVSVIVLRLVNLEADRVVNLLRHVLVVAAAELDRGAVVLVEESRFRIRRLPLGA
jgi:predicted nuclease of predicted toxin-antitoxin system